MDRVRRTLNTNLQVNVKGNFNIVHSLLSKRNTNAALLGCSAGTISVSPAYFLGHSAYTSSKIALVKFLEFVAAETPDLFVASYHPGVGMYCHSLLRYKLRPLMLEIYSRDRAIRCWWSCKIYGVGYRYVHPEAADSMLQFY